MAVEEVQGAEQEVALVEDQESVEDWPEVIDGGEAESERAGAGGTTDAATLKDGLTVEGESEPWIVIEIL